MGNESSTCEGEKAKEEKPAQVQKSKEEILAEVDKYKHASDNKKEMDLVEATLNHEYRLEVLKLKREQVMRHMEEVSKLTSHYCQNGGDTDDHCRVMFLTNLALRGDPTAQEMQTMEDITNNWTSRSKAIEQSK